MQNQGSQMRLGEVEEALGRCGSPSHLVPVVPVRTTEAWLLLDETAVRRVAGVAQRSEQHRRQLLEPFDVQVR